MPPQDTNSPKNGFQPGQFDFMMQQESPKKRLPIPKLPKPALFLLAGIIILFLIIIITSVISGSRSKGSEQLVDLASRSQEIVRVSDMAKEHLKANENKSLAVTASTSLGSAKQQLISYLADNGHKVDVKKLSLGQNVNTDKELETAAQNNNYDQVYLNYLKTSTLSYQTALTEVYKTASGSRQILTDAYAGTQAILAAPQLK